MTNCILWTKYRNSRGYGVRQVGSRRDGTRHTVLAHRWVWEQMHGPIPSDMCVLHSCDNPPCINIEHLWLGSRLDNNHDRDRKGRNAGLVLLRATNDARRNRCHGAHDPREFYRCRRTGGSKGCRACERERRATA